MHSLGSPHQRTARTTRTRRLRTVLGASALTVTLAVSTLGAQTALAPAEAAIGPLTYETQAFTATNVQRVAHGRAPLGPGACLHKWAVRQARKMANQQRMFHQDLQRVANDCGLSYAGENVAYGYSSGRAVVRAWMGSPGHRANILNRNYRLMGIGARTSEDGTWYVAQVFGRKAR